MYLATEEILALLEQIDVDADFDDVEEIYIEPPAAADETDEDSDPEDNSFRDNLSNLSGRLLQAGAETILQSGKRIGS